MSEDNAIKHLPAMPLTQAHYSEKVQSRSRTGRGVEMSNSILSRFILWRWLIVVAFVAIPLTLIYTPFYLLKIVASWCDCIAQAFTDFVLGPLLTWSITWAKKPKESEVSG